jgi:VanZ family protein
VTFSAPTSDFRRFALVGNVAPAALYVGALFYTGLIRLAQLPEVGFMPTDKLLHGLAFGGLALLCVRAARVFLWRASSGPRIWFGIGMASFFGALLEACQYFVPYRSAELLDWVADTVGALLAAGLLALFIRLKRGRSHG